MAVLIAPTEPKSFLDLGQSSPVPEQYGADFLVPAPGFLIGIQRKEFPGDFLNSLYDGRLSWGLTKLTKVRVRLLVLEGRPKWSTSGALIGTPRDFRQSTLRSLLLTAAVEFDVLTLWTEDRIGTRELIAEVERWAAVDHHSLLRRPTEPKPEYVRNWTERDLGVFLLQGFEGIGPELAAAIYDHFGRVPLRWDVPAADLMAVKGIGKGKVAKLLSVVHESS